MKRYILIVPVLFLLSCSDKEEKVIDIHDLLPSAENGDSIPATEDEDGHEELLKNFQLINPDILEVGMTSKKHFIDRFGADTSFQYILRSKEDSLNYREWYFSDSVKTSNAFFNWLDIAGRGESVHIGDPIRLNDRSFEMFVNDSLIVMIEGEEVNFESWKNYLEAKGIEDWTHILQQKGKNKARWYYMEEGKMKPGINSKSK